MNTPSTPNAPPSSNASNSGGHVPNVESSHAVNVAAIPLRIPDEPAPLLSAQTAFSTAALTVEDIQTFVKKAIAGELWRSYKINQPPVDRPVRIYADGMPYFDPFTIPLLIQE